MLCSRGHGSLWRLGLRIAEPQLDSPCACLEGMQGHLPQDFFSSCCNGEPGQGISPTKT